MFSANTSQVSADQIYVEDVFSTYLYTSTGANLTITNGIDLSTKGGMVLFKGRSGSNSSYGWGVFDTARGVNKGLRTNDDSASFTDTTSLKTFNTTGFGIGQDDNVYVANTFSGHPAVSFTFRKSAKFFDVVTWTGNGSNRTISHNLGSTPGCIIVKRTDTAADWAVYHRGLTSATYYDKLNNYTAQVSDATVWNSTAPTSTVFSVGTSTLTNASGGTYVAYIFAHDTATDGIIQCGSFTTDGSGNATVNLGWEPQWLLIKDEGGNNYFTQYDNMRGWTGDGSGISGNSRLLVGATNAESGNNNNNVLQTGFKLTQYASTKYIYIAIRRGPMRTPTSGTSVFNPAYGNNMSVANTNAFTSGFATDLLIRKMGAGSEGVVQGALRGIGNQLFTEQTAAEAASTSYFRTQTGIARTVATNFSGWIGWNFRRAPSFFDEVCYTGTGSNLAVTHNLTVAPELMIVKRRDSATDWQVYCSALSNTEYLVLNTTAAKATGTARWNSTTPGLTTFTVGTESTVNASGGTYVAYLFASCTGVSKVGSYTGNGSSQTINCGFAAGARFVMIKRTDSTGDWYVWDTARGIVAANDPHLSLNTTAAEVTTDDSIDTDSSGFVVNQLSATNINVSSATYIYLAVA